MIRSKKTRLWMDRKGLTKLGEECNELGQIAAKKSAFMDVDIHPDRRGSMKRRLEEEAGDVIAAIVYVTRSLNLDTEFIQRRTEEKLKTFQDWDDQGNDRYKLIGIEEFGYEVLWENIDTEMGCSKLGQDVLDWIGVRNPSDLVSILPPDTEEVYDHGEFFKSVSEDHDMVVKNFFVGEVAYGYWDLEGIVCRAVSFCHGGPYQFLVARESFE